MPKLRTLLALVLFASTATACVDLADILGKKEKKTSRDDDDDDDDRKKKKKKKSSRSTDADAKDGDEKDGEEANNDGETPPKDGIIADTGFRPDKHGYSFRNTGGKFPLTPPVVNEAVMVKLFGRKACLKQKVKTVDCKLTPAAEEWAFMINRAMNGGQCEGMAVSALTFFKGHDKHDTFMSGATSTHALQREQVTPLIGYYWAYQAVDPVRTHVGRSRFASTPVSVEDTLVEMWKKKELATLGFWGPPGQGGHATTPYAIQDKGNGVHHILMYDNNYPDTERYIIIDRNANTWKYDVAAINPDVPKMPWGGNAESHSIVVIPLDLRLQKAACPFCKKGTTKKKKTVVPRSTTVVIEDDQGRRLGTEDGKDVNEIPGAEVVDLSAFLDGVNPEFSKMYIVPDESDFDITIAGASDKPTSEEAGVTVFGDGTAFTIEGVKNTTKEKDVLTIGRSEDGVSYKPASGRVPTIKVAMDDDEEAGGVAVRLANMKSDKDGVVDLRLDRKTRKLKVGGGGAATESYDVKIRNVSSEGDDDVVEEKGVKFKRGESHDIDIKQSRTPKGGAATPLKIGKGSFIPRPRAPKKPRVAPQPPPGKAEGPGHGPAPTAKPGPAPGPRPALRPKSN